MSQITTHVLDTSRGLPAKGLAISLFEQTENGWNELAHGTTNSDGRVSDLLSDEVKLSSGNYRVHFATTDYFNKMGDKIFYPFVDIVFTLDEGVSHYHIPLLVTAFGYSTYRGS